MVLQNSEMNIKIEFEGLLWPKNETWRTKLADLKVKGWIWPKNETLGTRLANLEVEGPTWPLVESWEMNLPILSSWNQSRFHCFFSFAATYVERI